MLLFFAILKGFKPVVPNWFCIRTKVCFRSHNQLHKKIVLTKVIHWYVIYGMPCGWKENRKTRVQFGISEIVWLFKEFNFCSVYLKIILKKI